jgi:hypothetical protein
VDYLTLDDCQFGICNDSGGPSWWCGDWGMVDCLHYNGELTQRALQTHEGFEAHNKAIRLSDSTSQPEELVYGGVVNSQTLHPGLGLLLGMEEASASTVSAVTASASTVAPCL